MSAIALGLQLYTLRNETAGDFVGTLGKVKEIGYQGVEFAGYGNLSAKELHHVLRDLDLTAVSSHIPLQELEHHLDAWLEYNLQIGCSYIVCPWLPPERRNAYEILAETLQQIGESCNQMGIQFCYHHHDFEFETINHHYALDILLDANKQTAVNLEMDIYWAAYAGTPMVPYIEKYQGRLPLMHLKDMESDAERAFAPVGTGQIDIEAAIAAGKEAGVKWFLVEQDVCKIDPFESIQISYDYLKGKGYV